MKPLRLILVCSLCLAAWACRSAYERSYHLPLAGASHTLRIAGDWGSATLSLDNWQGHLFTLAQDYDLRDTLHLYRDSLLARFKGSVAPVRFSGRDTSKMAVIAIGGRTTLSTEFRVDEDVNKGDTLVIDLTRYAQRNGSRLDFPRIVVIIPEDLRGPLGV